MAKSIHVIYPISGNPPSWGHADVMERAARIFDKITWALAVNPKKTYLFTTQERLAMMEDYVRHFGLKNVTINSYEGATVRHAEHIGAHLILKGLRNATDLQAEMEQAIGNLGMNNTIDTITFFTSPRYSVISSSLIRELALLGENLEAYVLPSVAKRIGEILERQGLVQGK